MASSRDYRRREPAPRARGRAHHRLRLLRAARHRCVRRLRRLLPSGARSPTTPSSSTPTRRAAMRMLERAGLVPDAALQHHRLWQGGRPAGPPGGVVKRHLLVTNDFPPKVGGIQNYLWDLWSRLDPATYVVLTASSDPDAAAFDAAQAARGVHIERVPGSTLFFPTPQRQRRRPAVRAGPRDRPGAARPGAAPRPARPRLGVPYGVILHGAEVAVPGRLPALAPALASVLRGALRRHLGRRLPGRRGPPRRARTWRHRSSPSRPGSTPRPSRPSRRPSAAPCGRASACRPGAARRQRQPAGAAQGHGRADRGGQPAGPSYPRPRRGHRRCRPRAGAPRAAGRAEPR